MTTKQKFWYQMFKMKPIYYLGLLGVLWGQDYQVHSSYTMAFNITVFGHFKTTYHRTIAPGLLKVEEKTKAERFYAGWLLNEEVGEIMMQDSKFILKYNEEDEEYWLETYEDYFKEPDTSSGESYSYSIGFSSDESNGEEIKVTRTGGKEIETLHGFRTKKWITTLSAPENKLVFEEWYVDKLPLMKKSDSLEVALKSQLHPTNDTFIPSHSEFSSNLILDGMDTLTTLKPIDGYSVKMNLFVYEEKNSPTMTISFELLELYTEPVDTSDFTVPVDFEKIEPK